jgi:hydrogenase nickel incorporation protein HypA/HybF
MHELALAESIVDAVAEHVGDARVVAVRLRVGRLAAVLPEALCFCFEVCAEGTPLEGASLHITDAPGRGVCRACGAEIEMGDLLATCPCGSAGVEVIGGRDLRIESVEVI